MMWPPWHCLVAGEGLALLTPAWVKMAVHFMCQWNSLCRGSLGFLAEEMRAVQARFAVAHTLHMLRGMLGLCLVLVLVV